MKTSRSHWRWASPALVIIAASIGLMNPISHPWMRKAWWILLTVAAIQFGYFLYIHFRDSRIR